MKQISSLFFAIYALLVPCASHGQTFQEPLVQPFSKTSIFGESGGPFGSEYHLGIDLANYENAPVKAVAGGTATVYLEGGPTNTHGYGNIVIIEHFISPTFYTLYAHLNSVSVSNGQIVSAGQTIGTLGDTGAALGAHLHFELKYWGTIGAIADHAGEYSPTPQFPSFYGQMDPEPFFTNNVTIVTPSIVYNSTARNIYSKPGSGRVLLTSVDPDVPLMAFAYYAFASG